MRKYIFIFIFISFFTNCSTISTLLESGYDDPVKLLNSAIDDVAVAIQPSIDENFDKEVEAFFEQNERFTDPESPDYDPYFKIRYVIDSDNRSITRLSNDSVIKLIKEMDISIETDEIKEDMIKYSIVSQFEYEELFATAELREQNRERYLECWAKLRELRTMEYFASKQIDNTSVGSEETNNVAETDEVENNHVYEIVNPEKTVQPATDVDDTIQTDKSVGSRLVFVIDDYGINEFELSKNKEVELLSICESIACKKVKRIIIEGHTCDLGTEAVNNNVGLNRANVVKTFLNKSGVQCDDVEVKSLGASFPVVDNKINKRKNRRVVINVIVDL